MVGIGKVIEKLIAPCIYHLRITKTNDWEEDYFLVAEGTGIGFYYMNPKLGLEKLPDPKLDHGWNLHKGGRVNLMEITGREDAEVILGAIKRLQEAENPDKSE